MSTVASITACANWRKPASITSRRVPEQALAKAYARSWDTKLDDTDSLEIEGRHHTVGAVGTAWRGLISRRCATGRAASPTISNWRAAITRCCCRACRGLRQGCAERLRRFVWLIDEFYDRRVKLMISAEVAASETCRRRGFSGPLSGEPDASLKDRLVSRLTEMQTREYLTEPHLP